MDNQQSSIEGQTIIKAVGDIVAADSGLPLETVIKNIGDLFDTFAKKLDEYKKKDQGNQ